MKRSTHFSIQIRLLCLLFVLACQAYAQQTSLLTEQKSGVILGVLEDHSGIFSGDPYFRVVRAVFHKIRREWKPFPNDCSDTLCLSLMPLTKSYPQQVNWTIAFDGKEIGHVVAHTPVDFRLYCLVGIEEIVSKDTVPTVGKRSERYAGWEGNPVYRPLVAVSQPNFKDPDIWKPAQFSPAQIKGAREAFRNKFPDVSNCKNPEEDKLIAWPYRDDDIKVNSIYSSKAGWSLIELSLTGYACDGPVDDNGPFVGQWYVIEPSGMVRFIGAGMRMVDAGDYDGDGKTEVLFAVEGYNEGGYRLFYRDFSQSAEFLFSYH